MDQTLASTNFSPSEVHAIVEIGAARKINAKVLSKKLSLEKSTVSRMVAKLIECGELCEHRSISDARSKELYLSDQGKKSFSAINKFAEQQVKNALKKMTTEEQNCVLRGLQLYASALKKTPSPNNLNKTTASVFIHEGHTTGLLGRTVEMHALFYHTLVGFGIKFESKVASEYSEFLKRWEAPENHIWFVELNNQIVGNIVIDGQSIGKNCALLRWFIIDEVARGTGVGNQLMQKAMVFCDEQGFDETHLWTFQGLDAARKLYEKYGFILVQENPGSSWGAEVIEQKFIRQKNGRKTTTG